MSRLRLLVVSIVIGALSGIVAAQDDPDINGKKKSEWLKLAVESKSERQRAIAVNQLVEIKPRDRKIVDTVRDVMLNDTAERVRLRALDGVTIFILTDSKDSRPLYEAFGKTLASDPAEAVRLKAIEIAKEFQKDKIRWLVPFLADAIKGDKSTNVRIGAAVLLGKAGEHSKSVVNVITEAFQDKDPGVRAALAESLGRIGDEGGGAIPKIVPLLKDADGGVRLAAAFALGRIGPDAAVAVPDLAAALASDVDATVRKEAARAFALLGYDARAAIPALAKSLREDKSEEVRQQAALALGKMKGEDLRSVAQVMIEAMRKDADKTVRIFIIHGLGTALGDGLRAFVNDFAEQLGVEKEGDVRIALIQELGALGPAAKDALPALRKCVADVQVTVRDEAKKAVKKVQEKQQ